MHWLWPIPVLLIAGVLGTVLGLLGRHAARRRRSLLAPWVGAGCESWPAAVLPRRSRWRALALAGTWVLVLVALARPQWGTVGSVADLGGTVVLAIDSSASMRAADVSPSRQALARQWVGDLAAQLPGCRLGLITFAGEAQVLCPPTVDHAIFRELLTEVAAAVPSREGSELGPALELGRKVLERAGGGILVVVTDGEYHDRDPGAALQGGRRGTLDLLTVTVGGSTPVPVPGPRAGAVVSDPRHGGAALTAAHPGALRALAQAAGGLAIDSAGAGAGAAAAVRFIAARLLTRTAPSPGVQPAERFQWPAALALVLLVLRLATPAVRRGGTALPTSRRPGAPLAPLLVLCLVVRGADEGSLVSARIEARRAASLQAPGHDRPRCLYNLALALQESGQAAEARQAYAEALALPGGAAPVRARCLNNLGVLDTGEARERLARSPDLAAEALGRARAALHEALRLDPHLEVADRNLREAQSLAERLQVRQALAGTETLADAPGAGVPPAAAPATAPSPLPPRAALPAAGSATASRDGVPGQDSSALERLCEDAGSAREFMRLLRRGRTPERPAAGLPW